MREVYVRIPSTEQKEKLTNCPIWEHEPETWEADYDERCETCLITEGCGYITLHDASMIRFKQGDLVTFQPFLKCSWTVEETIKKHYIFDI